MGLLTSDNKKKLLKGASGVEGAGKLSNPAKKIKAGKAIQAGVEKQGMEFSHKDSSGADVLKGDLYDPEADQAMLTKLGETQGLNEEETKSLAKEMYGGEDEYGNIQPKSGVTINEPKEEPEQSPLTASTLGDRRSLESDSGKWARLARRAKRKGYMKAAEQAFGKSIGLASVEPSIKTEGYREQEELAAQSRLQGMAKDEELRKKYASLLEARLDSEIGKAK